MGKKIPLSTSFQLPDGREVVIETGKLATQAAGSVVVKIGKTMLFATVVASQDSGENNSFFPLSVDYQEKFAAAGRIPGNFFRREAKLNDYEVLISRLVDRVIRPLFPDTYRSDTQVIINLISGEEETLPDSFAALAASAALTISNIPFAGPISEVRVARINGEYKVNPLRSELADADLDIIVGATIENVMMVEGEAKECSEADLIEAIKIGHDAVKLQCKAQLELLDLVGGVEKREVPVAAENEELKAEIEQIAKDKILEVARGALDKKARKKGFSKVSEELIEALTAAHDEDFVSENAKMIDRYYGKLQKSLIREMVLSESIRLDGRKFDEVRPIWVETDYLPSAHGSAIFNRGETQALTSLTLGNKKDELMIDTALNHDSENFILHYNFPGFSVGETRPMRGPGRREVGHANLAGRSLKQVLPSPDKQPYTMRLVADILESNGSSSMATVCAGSLALMDAGIKIKGQVSGIAMGMISDGDRTAILTDILGDEDALGDMDFKVTGTENGICGCQMDIKIDGLPYDLLEKALMQAREGRLHILKVMNEEIEAPREDLKPHAPKIVSLKIDKSFIGAIIGPGGKNIQELQSNTNTQINIEEVDDVGVVTISGTSQDGLDKAYNHIKAVAAKPEIGEVYEAKVVSVMPYGVFAEFLPGKSGLVHISEISWKRLDSLDGVLTEGDSIKVKLIDVDRRTGKFRLSRKALIEKPAGLKEERRDGNRRDNRNNRNRD